ncbi:flagellar FlbD family protein [Peribacillus psychrosaccharolyticus]|uniref:Flagellar FlbD family protein n=1 Tax=Peribacillus psychrosaccharolyticus TaxID=1407 RepID=A0A974S2I2_PERPY|nr:flagellar FlbD family protein [Peribacillus psychrosaccharolyticus]MEC2053811.1 flagellar FlbD family protein [Peribacillus psychrosaccharolyticus]MED3742575.1 flagellar FlbD family protein [Peribacillus psychrosaccharolyticus]QQT02563.1 flagellar FlbD family protein [Peribacillus psychrosaccharolyticus]
MINVTRLNGKSFSINALYIETIESLPDTTITFTSGKKIVVSEAETVVVQLITDFYRSVNVLGLRDISGEQHEK